MVRDGRRVWKPCSFGQPLPDTRRPHSRRNNPHRHVEAIDHEIPKCGHETSAIPTRSGLRITCRCPTFSGKGGHQAAATLLLLLAVIGRVRLAGNDENLADADMLDSRLARSHPI